MIKKKGRKPKKGVAKLETVAVRLTSKQKYGLELLRRRYKVNSLSEAASSAIDSAIDDGLTVNFKEFYKAHLLQLQPPDKAEENLQKIKGMLDSRGIEINETNIFGILWDPEEADRVVSLGSYWPALLDYPIEELAWKIIQEDKKYWSGSRELAPNRKKIREDWDEIKKQAEERAK